MATSKSDVESARVELYRLTLRQVRAEWPYAAVFSPTDRSALSALPTPVHPSAPAR